MPAALAQSPMIPQSLPRPSWTARRCVGHAEITEAAAQAIDRVLAFHKLDPAQVRNTYIDTCRQRDLCRLSWVARRSDYDAVQTFRHERVRFAFDDLIIRSGKTLLIESPFGDPVDLIAYRLAIEPGGLLRVDAPLTLTVGQLLGLATARSAYADSENLSRIVYHARSGQSGAPGLAGAAGSSGSRDIPDGVAGTVGGVGGEGEAGQALPDQSLFIHHLAGNLEITAQAGAGGAGGPGGPGGDGGRGHAVAFFDMGGGGDGGPGGDGGDGGRGGAGGRFEIGIRDRAEGARLRLITHIAPGGHGGTPGTPGRGGIGAPDGHAGHPGPHGRQGADGTPISLIWTEGKDPADA
ncbi:MAG: hypothetical protein ACOVKO_05490 [Elstera sp.]